MSTPATETNTPELLDLLQRQPAARRQQIQSHWGAPNDTPAGLFRFMTQDPARFTATLAGLPQAENVRALLLDMVQEYSLPVTLYPEDQEAKKILASWGLIYPYPPGWGPTPQGARQWTWLMPVETAVLCAPSVEIFRFGLPLMLSQLSPEQVVAVRQTLGLNPQEGHVSEILEINRALCDHTFLARLLMNPDWQEHLFTLQILLEWHGVCHRHELFSFAWGDETLKPLTDRSQRRRERQIESDLAAHGLIYNYTPPPMEGDVEPPDSLVALPEELRSPVWSINRHLQEAALCDLLIDLGGWQPDPSGARQSLDHEPADLLKALACVLDAAPLTLDDQGRLSDDALDTLQALHGPAPDTNAWHRIIDLGRLTQALADTRDKLEVGAAAPRLLDQGPLTWSHAALQLWVEGTGPHDIDRAQNEAFGVSQIWLDEIRPALKRGQHRHQPLEGWWRFIDHPEKLGATLNAPRPRSRRQQGRPAASWFAAPGVNDEQDIMCGFPRVEVDRERLDAEVLLVEGIVLTFRLLLLDLLGGLCAPVLSRVALSSLIQDTAALAIHLNLPVMFFDPMGQTFIPVRPPTYIVEATHDAAFDKLTNVLIDALLIPAGVVEPEGDELRIFSHRVNVKTPLWFDHDARVEALSALTQSTAEEIEDRKSPAAGLRPVSGKGESDRRFWLGRPLAELRRAIDGRKVTAFGGGYLEVNPQGASTTSGV